MALFSGVGSKMHELSFWAILLLDIKVLDSEEGIGKLPLKV